MTHSNGSVEAGGLVIGAIVADVRRTVAGRERGEENYSRPSRCVESVERSWQNFKWTRLLSMVCNARLRIKVRRAEDRFLRDGSVSAWWDEWSP